YSVASSDILRSEELQALGTDDPPFISEEKSSQLEDLPLYQPTMADVLDLMKHPPTTLAAPYMEPDGMNDEYSTVYKVRGHYDVRMRDINKHAKERKNSGTQNNHASKVGAKDSTYSTTSDVDQTFPVRTHRIAGLKRPARPQREGRQDVRRRGVLESHPDFDRRHSGERPSYEPRPGRIPRSKRPVWQPDDNGSPRGAPRGTRRRDSHSGYVDRTTTPMAPVEASPPFSTELNHGVKIVSEPGARRPRQGPPPKPQVLSSLPRSSIPRVAGPKATGVNDDPTSVHMREALAEEPALPYDKVVDEDTTEAVDVSRLVEENAFDRRLRKLEEQQELAETKMLLDDGDEPDPNLSPVEDDSSDGGNEEKNVSAIEQEPQINSPVAPQKPIAAAEDDQMVEVEDLGYELATKRNTSSSQGRMLVPIVDDYFDTNELANTTANATAEFPLDIGGDITDKETANATLTDVKMKRRKYSIASRVWFGNESLYVERINATNSSDPLQSGQSVGSKWRPKNRNNSKEHDAMSLQSVSLRPESKLQVICHDFEQCASDRWVKQLKEALLNEAEDNNVLVVGWRQAASRNYWTAVANTRPVGRKLACLLRRLRDERGLRLRNVHLVGLGLGAHVARYAAISVVHKLCERVGRVTGLDVSAPLFEEFGETLNAAVAEYVDLVHTSADFVDGLRGQIAATGHVDYYAPGVFSPKSCAVTRRDLQRDCNHALSAELFVQSVRDGCGYRSTSCEFWTTKETCSGCGPRGCGHMGFSSPLANGTGAQFLTAHAPNTLLREATQ
ncbi:hypothetical protein MRX96_046650, partial [Rhipicephalus microplus]